MKTPLDKQLLVEALLQLNDVQMSEVLRDVFAQRPIFPDDTSDTISRYVLGIATRARAHGEAGAVNPAESGAWGDCDITLAAYPHLHAYPRGINFAAILIQYGDCERCQVHLAAGTKYADCPVCGEQAFLT